MAKKKKQETPAQELKRLRALTEVQQALLDGYGEFTGSLPSSMGDVIEGYWELRSKVDFLSEPFNDPEDFEYDEEGDSEDDDDDWDDEDEESDDEDDYDDDD